MTELHDQTAPERHARIELDEQHSSTRMRVGRDRVRRDARRLMRSVASTARAHEGMPIHHCLDDAGDEGHAGQARHVLGHVDGAREDGIVVDDHVLVGVLGRALEAVVGAVEEVAIDDVEIAQQRQ